MHAPRPGPRLDNRSYYDEFASWYERERGRGYHQMLDDLELDLVERYGRGADVLEAGCGTGLLLERAARFARCSMRPMAIGMPRKMAGAAMAKAMGSPPTAMTAIGAATTSP